jgi:hypothetical protein
VGLLHGRTGRLAAQNGGLRPGQFDCHMGDSLTDCGGTGDVYQFLRAGDSAPGLLPYQVHNLALGDAIILAGNDRNACKASLVLCESLRGDSQ